MTAKSPQRCFLLTINGRDTSHGYTIELYGKNEKGIPVYIFVTNYRPLFFIPHNTDLHLTVLAAERKPLDLTTFSHLPVDCCYFSTYSAMQECIRKLQSASIQLFESDIHPVDRFLMERLVYGGFEATGPSVREGSIIKMVNPRIRGADASPKLKTVSIDIETNVRKKTLYSIACAGTENMVFLLGKGENNATIHYCHDERNLINRFLDHLSLEDPDVIIGWNVIDFDLKFIYERCRALNISFIAGRNKSVASVYETRSGNRTIARVDGRVIIDLPITLRTYYHSFEEYSLNYVASELLGKSKEITLSGKEKIEEIDRLYATDKSAFAHYNLQDALLTREIFDITGTLPDAIERTRRSGHLLDRIGGSIASFDYLYLPRLHRSGYVAPDPIGYPSYEALPGGYVIEPEPGIYDNVIVLDFRSLYPSIIMSFGIDPLALRHPSKDRIQGPTGPSFSRSPSILPAIISELMEARTEAKKNKNGPLSQAIKILMNSFYGVLGARNCRFFSVELATTITQTGQYILKKTIEFIESTTKHKVIYGDTDSLFVLLGNNMESNAVAIGQEIAQKVTAWLERHLQERFSADSSLLLQFENHFRHFLIPAVRGATHGSKKHYCGGSYVDDTLQLHFKGMESARSDWTDLAKEFQQELIRRIFSNEHVDDYILTTVAKVKNGQLDEKLLYKKRLRKQLAAYTQSIPPHVQAARQLKHPPHLIRYYITLDGPQPIEKLHSPLDYQHYIDAQLQPVADSVLELTGRNFGQIVSGQQDLFGG